MKYRWLLAGLGLMAIAPAEAFPQGEPRGMAPPGDVAKKLPVDLSVKSASVEVAWLSDPATYAYRLRAEQAEDAIALSGYVPSEAVHQKAAALARMAAVGITLQDRIIVLPQMALPAEQAVESNQLAVLRGLLDKAVPAVAKQVQLTLDSQGIVTLSGRVDELADRRRIIRALQAVPGCTCVKYDLRMAPSVLVTMPVPSLDLPREEPKTNTFVPTGADKPAAPKEKAVTSGAMRQGVLTSKTPAPAVQQVEYKPPPAASSGDKPRESAKAKDPAFLIPSASGLTPPAPGVSLGQPKPYRSNFLGDGYILPATTDPSSPPRSKPPELLKDLPPAPALPEPPPLPVVSLPPVK